MGLTLVEAAKLAANGGNQVQAAVIRMIPEESDILRVMPFTKILGNSFTYNLEGSLPGIAFRAVGGSYTPSTGIVNPKTEYLRLIGGEVDVDRFIIETQGSGARAYHLAAKVRAMNAEVTRCIIKGDSTSNVLEFDGLQVRCVGSQVIDNGTTDGGDVLSLAKLDEAIDNTVGPTHIIASKAVRRILTQASRNPTFSGLFGSTVDAFGRQISTYGDLPILVPYTDGVASEPLAFDELGYTGSTATATSIYVVGFGDDKVSGIESQSGISARDLGEKMDNVEFKYRLEWYPGMMVKHGKAVTRLKGIKAGAAVA